MISRTGIFVVATCLVCGGGLSAQTNSGLRMTPTIDRAPSAGAIGTRVSFLFARHNDVLTGVEFGYSKLAGVESGMPFGDNSGATMVHRERSDRRMYHATLTARRSWFEGGPAGVYAGGGTGVYMINHRTEYWDQTSASADRLDFRTNKSRALEWGLNIGGGLEFRPIRSAGAFDLDARLHFLPFSGSSGVRSVFIISAGLSIF